MNRGRASDEQVALNRDLFAVIEAGETSAARRVQELLAVGADVEAVGLMKQRPLHVAVEKDATVVVKVLIQAGADVESADSFGKRPLHWAAGKDAPNAAKALIKAGADTEAVDRYGRRPLHWAAGKDAKASAKVLIRARVNINAKDKHKEAPLHVAAKFGSIKTVQVLLGAGAACQLRNNEGKTPAQLARDKGFNAVVEVLEEDEKRRRSALQLAQCPEKREKKASGGSPSHGPMFSSQTPTERQPPAVSPVAKKPSPELQQASLNERLREAAGRDYVELLHEKLAVGAEVESADSAGRRPLHWATATNASATAMDRAHDRLVEALREKAGRRSNMQLAQHSQEIQQENVSTGVPAYELLLSLKQSTKKQTPTTLPSTDNSPTGQSQVTSQIEIQSTESRKSKVETPPQHVQSEVSPADSTISDSDSSWTSDEVADSVKAVQDLKEDEIFAENYVVERTRIIGKPLARLAKGLETKQDVVLKFYDKPELYAKAVSFFERLNKSLYVCKPIEKISAHEGFPDCLVFEKGIYTLDEWMRIPDISLTNKKETLQLVAFALDDLHSDDVVHCDVKPSNLAFFPAEHRWKLLDIDSAMEVGVADDIFATISYASPEVLEVVDDGREELALQTSSDMWAYGIIAFEVFTGKRFYEFEPTVESVLKFLKSERFKHRLDALENKKHKHFVQKFLKYEASERQSARRACTSSIFESATVSVSRALTPRVGAKTKANPKDN